jgi:hypothetical protein
VTFRTRAKTIALLAISAVSAVSARSGAPKAVVPVARFEFGEVLSGAVVECDFIVKNEGGAPLVIQRVAMTAPLVVTRMSREVAPGAEGTIHFRLDTANLAGTFRGVIVVFLNDPALPEASLAFEGTVVPAIEVSPLPGFFVAGLRGRGGQKAIEIVNHESEPLQLEKVEHLTERFTTQLETLEPGRRYRLTLHLRPDGPGGKSTGTILLRTSSKTQPHVQVAANTYLYERVHTFPDVADFGTLRTGEVGGAAVTLMVYQEGGSDFEVKVSTDLPALRVRYERGPRGDRYQATITLQQDMVHPGPFTGTVTIETNDPGFKTLSVPVQGTVVP